jgi:hypothetical protein
LGIQPNSPNHPPQSRAEQKLAEAKLIVIRNPLNESNISLGLKYKESTHRSQSLAQLHGQGGDSSSPETAAATGSSQGHAQPPRRVNNKDKRQPRQQPPQTIEMATLAGNSSVTTPDEEELGANLGRDDGAVRPNLHRPRTPPGGSYRKQLNNPLANTRRKQPAEKVGEAYATEAADVSGGTQAGINDDDYGEHDVLINRVTGINSNSPGSREALIRNAGAVSAAVLDAEIPLDEEDAEIPLGHADEANI